MKSKDIAEANIKFIDDPLGALNLYQALDPDNDYIMSVGNEVYGVLNDTQLTIGYDLHSYFTILNNGLSALRSKELDIKCEDVYINTSAYGLKWNGYSVNPELFSTNLTFISEKMIGNLINICNNVTGLPQVTADDIRSYEIFTVETPESKAKALERKYPIVSGLKWKSELQLNCRNDLSYTPIGTAGAA